MARTARRNHADWAGTRRPDRFNWAHADHSDWTGIMTSIASCVDWSDRTRADCDLDRTCGPVWLGEHRTVTSIGSCVDWWAHTHALNFVCILYTVCCHNYMCYFCEHVNLDLFSSLNLENVRECCEAQWVCVHQRIALCKTYLLLLLSAKTREQTVI